MVKGHFDGKLEVLDNKTNIIINSILIQSKLDMDLRTSRLFYLRTLPVRIIDERGTSPEDLKDMKELLIKLNNL
jgi:hypothetical protein